MKVFLTGGTGFIGQPLTKALLARGWNVMALVRNPNSLEARALTRMGAQCVRGDITGCESMRAWMTGADIVIHNAGWYEVGIPASARTLMHSINVKGTDNVLSLALELGIPRTIHISTVAYFGDTGAEICDETYRRQASTPRCVRKNRSVERIESAHSIPCCHKHLKGLEPLHTRSVCFRACITPQSIHFSPGIKP